MAHTPGPWVLNGWDVVRAGCDDSFPKLAAIHNGRRTLCLEEINANARLIAAAPELLAQLKMAAEFISGHNECLSVPSGSGDRQWNDYCIGLLEDCKAAISKAEGGSE